MSSYPTDTTPRPKDGDVLTLKKILLALLGGGDGNTGGAISGYEKVPQGPIFLLAAPTGGDPFVEVLNRPEKTSGLRFWLEEGAFVEFGIGVIGLDPDADSIGETVVLGASGGAAFFDVPIGLGENFYIAYLTGVAKGQWCQR